MSSDTAKENASVVDSSLTDWKQDLVNSDDPESSGYRNKEDHKLSMVDVEQRNFTDQIESSNTNKSRKLGYQTRYFIIKSLNYENIQLSVERGIWATQVMNEPILEGAFHSSRVILIFSVNMSGFFQGYAEMLSPVGWRRDHIWSQGGGKNNPWGRSFKVKWLRLSELPFQKTLHLKNPLNDYKPVKISRDCQELPEDIGEALCELLDANSCDDGLLNSSARDDYSTKTSRAEPPSSSGDEYNNNMWGHTPMPYLPAVYQNQDDLSRFHLAQQRGYGSASEYLHSSSGASKSRTEQENSLRYNSWGLPLESALASSLTDDDFLNMSYEEYLETHSRCMKQLGLPVITQSRATQEPSSKTDDVQWFFERRAIIKKKRTAFILGLNFKSCNSTTKMPSKCTRICPILIVQ